MRKSLVLLSCSGTLAALTACSIEPLPPQSAVTRLYHATPQPAPPAPPAAVAITTEK